jgi:hypothetical protein
MRPIILLILSSMVLFLCCSNLTEAGSSVSGNGRVSGCLLKQGGLPAPYAQVMILSETYNPVLDAAVPDSLVDTTDAAGRYSFLHVDYGTYNIQAISLVERTRLFTRGIHVNDSAVTVPTDTLRPPGTIKVMLPDSSDAVNGYVYIPGTTFSASVGNNSGFKMLDSVPAGVLPAVNYTVKNSAVEKVIRYNVGVTSGDTALILMPEWKYARQLYLNTTASGANIQGTVENFPVLVRLNAGNFNFSQAHGNGSDIRFTKTDGASLPYEIERWDASQKSAEIWVKVDTVFGNNGSQNISMFWGNLDTVGASDGTAVFDTVHGFQGVWHMGQSATAVAFDATANRFDGVPSDSSPIPAPGAIGMCQEFNGTSNFIQMPGTASGKLNFPEQGFYSIAAWVYLDTLDTTIAKIIEKHDLQYKLQKSQFNQWEFSEYESVKEYSLTTFNASSKTWAYLTGVRSGGLQYLYVNGVCVTSAITILASPYSRDTADNITIGRAAATDFSPLYFFKGKIDETRIENRARSADWIKLCFMNQKVDDALVMFKP